MNTKLKIILFFRLLLLIVLLIGNRDFVTNSSVLEPAITTITTDNAQNPFKIKQTPIHMNVPKFKLGSYKDLILLYTFPMRVGQNRKKYLKMCDRITDLRTETGQGKIVDCRRDPFFYNPVDGKRFNLTKRDDERTRLMPQIPKIETEINGIRNGQLIHLTTYKKSLAKAFSIGCIGTKKSDAWAIYYHTPVGTSIIIRYNLKVKNFIGNEKVLTDVYGKDTS